MSFNVSRNSKHRIKNGSQPGESPHRHAWLRLVRAPNLLTVPGDPLAGFFLAASEGPGADLVHILPCVLACLLLYMAGVISNDCVDLAEDRRERSDRPLPSGRIRLNTAITAAVITALLGSAAAAFAGTSAFVVAVLLTAAVVLYNVKLKSVPFLGPVNMGMCRALSLLLGASATGRAGLFSYNVVIAAGGLMLYIASVTAIASKETLRIRIGAKRWMPAASLLLCLVLLFSGSPADMSSFSHMVPDRHILTLVCAVAALALAAHCGMGLSGIPGPTDVSRIIGRLLRGLLLLQAAFLMLCDWPGQIAAIAVLCLWPLSSILARRFYES